MPRSTDSPPFQVNSRCGDELASSFMGDGYDTWRLLIRRLRGRERIDE